MKRLLWIGCLSYLVIGIAHVVGGSVLEPMMAHYGLAYRDGGQWIMNQFLGFLAGVLLAPALSGKLGKRGVVLLAMGALTVSEAAYSLLLPWEWMLAVAPIAGFGFGMTEAIVGAMVIDLVKDGKASAVSRLETFFGLGALLIPITAAYLIQQHIWQLSFPILAALSGITFVLWLTMSFGNETDDALAAQPAAGQRDSSDTAVSIKRGKRGEAGVYGYAYSALPFLALAALFFMIYVGMEMSFSNYLPSIMIDRSGMEEAGAAAVLGLFWGMVVVGRLFAGVLADRIGYVRYLAYATIGATIVISLMGMVQGLAGMLILTALCGLFFSGMFGIALVYANELLPGMTERTTSILVAFGGLGGAIFPRITGWMMDVFHVGATLWYIAALVGLLLVLLIVMLVLGRKRKLAITG
ncbi:MFS transporter [Paenibacillus sp. J5C_2022]|uniref:MFS transporter n=1 Tax=Paenibacillus sp. J5C2022 TaxID=2977129 RepID=UPI0021D21C93|nr:MFS transporter [Paenibacillus sp. J5C2022]MCU6708547.1 MFS transporter [Paenibacillus sp. J5C2022]